MERLIVQIRKYPYIAGEASRSIIVDDLSLETASARIDILYQELDSNNEARIIFRGKK
jgi:hypothetical protein